MNGDEVLRALKKNEELKHLPVLMVSSASDMENIVDCIRLGADDYLAMPLNNTLLHARINACLTKKKSRDREQETLAMLDASQQQLTTAIENIDEGFAVFDANDFLTTYNKKFAEFYPVVEDFQQEAVYYKLLIQAGIEKNLYQLIKHDSCALQTSKFSPKDGSKFLKGYLAFHANPTRPRVDLLTTGLWVEVIENKIPGGGTVAIHKDISAIKRTEEALHYTAMHDALTGLANRKNFDKVLESVTKEAKKKNEQFAIMFFDLDGFKNINDTLGHDFGDLVLQTVAGKLKESVRDKDLVARFGGDEFAAVITNIPSMDECILIAERCLKTIGTEVERNGKVATFGVSIGIALYPNHAEHTVELLKKADEAMYVAKKSGKGTYRMAS
jgi:diguanylate cyclase (GGDEF)-like protein